MAHLKIVLALCLLVTPAAALQLPDGAVLRLQDDRAYTTLDLPTAQFREGELPHITVQGQRRDEAWVVSSEESTLRVMEGLLASVEAEGFEVLFSCRDTLCGGFDFRRSFEILPAPQMYLDFADFRFFSAQRGADGLAVLVSKSVGAVHVQINQISAERQPAQTPSAPIGEASAEPASTALFAVGHSVLEGIEFETGSAAFTGGEAALAQLAAILQAEPDLKLILVGHSDASGSLAANIALSKARAAAVRQRLVQEFKIAPSRLFAEGAGYLAPIVPHGGEQALENRRIEAVLLP